MKRKILSLALALMMIISVAAAMPVSAEVADIVIAGNAHTAVGATGSNTGSVYDGAVAGAAQYWGTKSGKANSVYADYALEVATAGYYNVTIAAAGQYASGNQPATTLTIDDQEINGIYPVVTIGTSDVIDTTIARVYLTADTHALRVSEIGGAHYDIHSITFSYDETQTAATTLNIKPFSGTTTNTGYTFFYTDAPDTDVVEWATARDVGFYKSGSQTNCNVTNAFVNDAAGNYDVIIVNSGTTDATAKVTIGDNSIEGTFAATTGKTVVQETNLGPIYIPEGPNTIKTAVKVGTSMKYIYNIKLVWSDTQPTPPEPEVPHADMDPRDGSKTSGSYVFTSSAAPTSTDADWINEGRVYIYGNSKGHGVSGLAYTIEEAGYYDVLVGASYVLTGGEVLIRLDGAGTVQGAIDQTASDKDAKANNLGRIYLPAGSSTLDLRANLWSGNTANHMYIYNIRLEKSDDQTEASSITLNAGFAKATSGTGEQNRMDWKPTTNTAGWATSTISKLSGATTYIDLDMYVPTGAYYDVYAAAGTISASGMLSLRIGGTEVIDKVILTYDGTSALTNAQETYVGKVYIPAGSVDLRAESDQDAGAYYLYNLKFTKSATQPAANDVRIVDNGGLDLASGFYAGTKAFAEVKTSDNVKVFIVNYQDLGNGYVKMVGCKEGAVVVTDNGTKIIKTPALTTAAGTVKAFLWDGATFAPIDFAAVTVVAAPTPEA